jgi:signal transduction histidine kinase/CheY-like chemotaxis protein
MTENDSLKRQQLENDLKDSRENYRFLFDHVPVIIWEEDLSELRKYFFNLEVENKYELRKLLLDESSKILKECMKRFKVININETAVKKLHAPNKQDLIENLTTYFPELGLSNFIENLILIYEGKRKFQHESKLKTKNGEIIDVLVSWEVVSGYDDFSKVIVIMIDITKEKEIEKERKYFDEQIQHLQKVDSLGLLAGGIAHDFNNLLVPILGNINLAQTYTQKDSQIYNHLKQIEETILRASELTKQLLTYSGKGKFLVEICNLNEIISDLVYLISLTATKTVEINYNLKMNLPNIEADKTQIQQILINLISNATSAMDNKGKIIISTDLKEFNQKELESVFSRYMVEPGWYVVLEIEDTGKGIPKNIQENIFDPFFTTKDVGKGLGLSVVHGIVVTHKGGIKYTTSLNEGTKFTVIFPQTKLEDKKYFKKEGTGVKQKIDQKTTAIVCDDEPSVLEITALMVKKLGFNVLETKNGLEVLEILQARSDIDIIVLDLIMPGMDGEKTSREISKLNPNLPILLVSGYNEHEIELKYSGLHISGFLQKPYSFDTLKEKIFELIK